MGILDIIETIFGYILGFICLIILGLLALVRYIGFWNVCAIIIAYYIIWVFCVLFGVHLG